MAIYGRYIPKREPFVQWQILSFLLPDHIYLQASESGRFIPEPGPFAQCQTLLLIVILKKVFNEGCEHLFLRKRQNNGRI